MKTEVNLVFCALILNGVWENVLVCAHFSSNFHMALKMYAFVTQLFECFWNTYNCFPLLCPNFAMGALNHISPTLAIWQLWYSLNVFDKH